MVPPLCIKDDWGKKKVRENRGQQQSRMAVVKKWHRAGLNLSGPTDPKNKDVNTNVKEYSNIVQKYCPLCTLF